MFGNPDWELYPQGEYCWEVLWRDNSLHPKKGDYPPLGIIEHDEVLKKTFPYIGKFYAGFCPALEGILEEGDFCKGFDRGRFLQVTRVTIQVKGFSRAPNEAKDGG